MPRARMRITAFVLVCASIAHAEPEAVDAARSAYDRGAAAYDRGDYPLAAAEAARADELAPNDVALELALKASVKAEDAPLAMTLVARAEGRDLGQGRPGNATLRSARDAARARMASRTGRCLVTCYAGTICNAMFDDVPYPTAKAQYVLVGEHRVMISTEGRKEGFRVRVDPEVLVEVKATLGPQPVTSAPPKPETPTPTNEGGVSSAWFWLGLGVTAVLGGATIASAIDTRNKHDEFVAKPSTELSEAGSDAQLRTNLLTAGVAASAVVTGILGIFVVRWGSNDASSSLGGTPPKPPMRGSR